MAINFPDNIKVNVGNPIDSRYLSSGNTSYTSIGEVNTAIVLAQRYVGLTVNINNVEYWYKEGIEDTDLIEKIFTGGGTITGATNGLMIDGVNDKDIALGGDLITGTTINGVGLYDLTISNIGGFGVSTSGGTSELIVEPAGITLAFSGQSVNLDSGAGLTYGGDYSANYTARSLVDAGFVSGFTSNNYLKLDQTSGQTVINGMPKFEEGIMIGTTPSASFISGHTRGKIYYDNCYEALTVQIGDESSIQLSQESVCYVWNATGSIIPNGAVVRSVGTHCGYGVTADVPSVCLAKADTLTCALAMGVTTEEIGVGEYGFVAVRGYVNALNTTIDGYSGITVSEIIYLSPIVEGGVTNVVPTPPNIQVQIGRLTSTGTTTGRLAVEIEKIYRLDDLSDVDVPAPNIDDVLKWNGSEWVNATVGTTSAGSGVNFYYATPIINACTQPAGLDSTGTNGNGIQVMSLSKTPIVSGGTQYTCGCINTINTQYALVAWLYDAPLGRTKIDSGTWEFTSWLCASSAVGTQLITNNVYQVVPISGITISNITANAVRATVTNNGFTGAYFSASTSNMNSSWLQTLSGIYQICAKIDDNNVCIVKPTTHTVSGGTGNTWNRLFGATSADLTDTPYTCYVTTLAEPDFTISCTDKLGRIGFGCSSAAPRTYGVTYNGSTQASFFKSPLITLHNDLAGLQGGTGSERYHVTTAQNQLLAGITASAAEINVLDGISPTLTPTELSYVEGVTSSIQSQLNSKSNTGHTHSYTGSTITDKPIFVGSGATVVTNSGNTVVIYSSGGTGVEKFTDDIIVSIAAGKTFGKYENGDTIPASGKTPAEVIMMALIEALEPTVNLSSSAQNLAFGLSAKTVNLTFSYTINTLGASVDTVLLEWRRGNTGAWSALTTNTGATTYNHIVYEVNRFNTAVINYRYTVVDTAGATGVTTYDRTPTAYVAPTFSPTYTNTGLQSYETNAIREKGNVSSTIAGTIDSNNAYVNITGYTVYRCVDGGAYAQLYSCAGLSSTAPISIASCLDAGAAGAATTVGYCIRIGDEYSSAQNGGTCTITFRYASYYGYCVNTSISGSEIVALGNGALCTTRARTMTLTATGGNYTYVAYPESYGYLTSAIMDGAAPVLGAFSCSCDNSVTNIYGQAVDYNLYKSNAPNAFTANSVAFS